MSAVDIRGVRQVLRTQLLTVAGITAPLIAPENRKFDAATPPGLYIRETLLMLKEEQVSWGLYEVRGAAQYDVFVPKGSGTEVAEDQSTAIEAAFSPPTYFLQGTNLHVAIDGSQRLGGRFVDEAWYMSPVRVLWRTYANVG